MNNTFVFLYLQLCNWLSNSCFSLNGIICYKHYFCNCIFSEHVLLVVASIIPSSFLSPVICPRPQVRLCCQTFHILPRSAPLYPPQMGPVRQRLLAGRRWGVWASSGRVDACVRETLSHIPPAAGSAPAVGRGFASFSRPLRFLSSSGSYSFPARKQPFPCNCRRGREREKECEWEKEGCIVSPELGTAIPVLKS